MMNTFKNIARFVGKRLFLFAALALCVCSQLPEYCGDGKNSFNPDKQFCFENKPYDKCGGSDYDPRTHGCAAGEVKPAVTIAYNGNGNDGGAAPVDPNSPYVSGATVTVLAEGTLTRTGYSFTGWNTAADGSGINYLAGKTFGITGNTTLYARWKDPSIPSYTVTVLGNGTSASGGGNFEAGERVTISAGTPPAGREFKEWTVTSGDIALANPNSPTTAFTMPANDVTVTATFETVSTPTVTYTVIVTSAATDAAGGGNYAAGKEVSISAGTPPAGQQFKNWTVTSGGITLAGPNNAITTFTMPAKDVAVKANFETASTTTYTVTVTSAGNGATGSGKYLPGATITVYAGTPPSADKKFNGWTVTSGGITLANKDTVTTTFTMPSSNVVVTANFEAITTTHGFLTDSRDGQTYGTVTINGKTWMAENLNYTTLSGSICYNNSSDSCIKYGRLYDWITTMNIDASYGSTKWGGSDVNHQGVCPVGWHVPSRREWGDLAIFAGGTGEYGASGSGASKKLRSKTGWSSNSGTDDYGFSALPGGCASGSYFDYVRSDAYWWTATEDNDNYAYYRNMYYSNSSVNESTTRKNSSKYSVRCIQDDASNPTPGSSYSLTTGANPAAGGSVLRNPNLASYSAGALVSVKATPNAGYTFIGWSGASTSADDVITIAMNGNQTLTANFAQQSGGDVTATAYAVTVSRNPTAGGNVSVIGGASSVNNPNGAEFYNSGTSMTITATPSDGYTFSGWTAVSGSLPSGVTAASGATIAFSLIGNVDIRANFTYVGGGDADSMFIDSRDNQKYKKVKIGNQTWMARNLNIKTGNSWCYDDRDSGCNKYGRLYDWETAKTACPDGWHLPSRGEWGILAKAAGGTGTYGDGGTAGTKLKSSTGWYQNHGTDDYGFSALPGGGRDYYEDSFNDVGYVGYWWTATTDGGSYVYYRFMYYGYGYLYEDYDEGKNDGLSVRCIEN